MNCNKNKVIVCGSRGFTNYRFVKKQLDKILANIPKDIEHLEIVSGCCPNSPDVLGELYARELGFEVDNGIKLFPAKWRQYPRTGGFIRNAEMAEYATHCVAFWNGESPGTKDMIEQAEKYDLKIRIIRINK